MFARKTAPPSSTSPDLIFANNSRFSSTLRARCPKAKILLLGVFPRAHKPDHAARKNNEEINKIIAKLHNGERIHYLDISQEFLTEDGILPKSVMPDSLHLNTASYKTWADAIEPKVKELLGE